MVQSNCLSLEYDPIFDLFNKQSVRSSEKDYIGNIYGRFTQNEVPIAIYREYYMFSHVAGQQKADKLC